MTQRHDTPRPRRIRPWTFAAWALAVIVLGGAALAYFRTTSDDAKRRAQLDALGALAADDRTILAYARDAAWMDFIAPTFRAHCATCHGLKGQGMSAPNLTDDFYIQAARPRDLHDIIAYGRNHGAMPAWRNLLEPNEVVLLSSYAASLRGRYLRGRPVDQRAVVIPAWTGADDSDLDAGTEVPTPRVP